MVALPLALGSSSLAVCRKLQPLIKLESQTATNLILKTICYGTLILCRQLAIVGLTVRIRTGVGGFVRVILSLIEAFWFFLLLLFFTLVSLITCFVDRGRSNVGRHVDSVCSVGLVAVNLLIVHWIMASCRSVRKSSYWILCCVCHDDIIIDFMNLND